MVFKKYLWNALCRWFLCSNELIYHDTLVRCIFFIAYDRHLWRQRHDRLIQSMFFHRWNSSVKNAAKKSDLPEDTVTQLSSNKGGLDLCGLMKLDCFLSRFSGSGGGSTNVSSASFSAANWHTHAWFWLSSLKWDFEHLLFVKSRLLI